MLRRSLVVSFWAGCIVLCGQLGAAETGRPGENLLPKTTAGFVAVANFDQFKEHWEKTQLGHLINDPVMEPFTKDLRRQLEQRWASVRERLGLTLDDLREVAGGEIDLALIRPAPGEAATALLLDVSNHLQQATALLDRASQDLIGRGAKKSVQAAGGVNVLVFELPKTDLEPAPRTTVYFLVGTLFCATDNLDVTRGILARVPGDRGDSLADVPGYQAVMERCRQDAGQEIRQVRWFIHPLSYVDAVRASTPPEQRRKGKSILELLQNQGFAALQGVGGLVDFSTEGYELIHRTAIYAPQPWEKSMKMLVFPNAAEFAPPRWVPRDVATYSSFYADILNAFDNFGPFFDELFGDTQFLFSLPGKRRAEAETTPPIPPGQELARMQKALEAGKMPEAFRQEFVKLRKPLSDGVSVTAKTPGTTWAFSDKGESYLVRKKDGTVRVYQEITGIWKDLLDSLRQDPNGPQIDLREELIKHLGRRIIVLTDYQLPITTTSERLLFAIEATDLQAVTAGIEKMMKSNRNAKRHQIGERVVWEIVEEEDNPDMPKVEAPRVSIGPLHPLREPSEEKQEQQEEQKQPRLLPHAAVTVAHGQLLIASHLDFMQKILKPTEDRETLARNLDYLRVDEIIQQRLRLQEKCARIFSMTDEEYRPTYELVRQNRLPESESMLARFLNAVVGGGKKGTERRQSIDGRKLPDYDVVRRYLGPAGMAASTERDGWFIKGVLLNKE